MKKVSHLCWKDGQCQDCGWGAFLVVYICHCNWNGTEGSNFHIRDTWLPEVKCLMNGAWWKTQFFIRHHFTCLSSNLIHCISCSKCGLLYIGETGRSLRTRFGEHRRSIINTITPNLLPDISPLATSVSRIWKFEHSAPFQVAMTAVNDKKCASSTVWHSPSFRINERLSFI